MEFKEGGWYELNCFEFADLIGEDNLYASDLMRQQMDEDPSISLSIEAYHDLACLEKALFSPRTKEITEEEFCDYEEWVNKFDLMNIDELRKDVIFDVDLLDVNPYEDWEPDLKDNYTFLNFGKWILEC